MVFTERKIIDSYKIDVKDGVYNMVICTARSNGYAGIDVIAIE